MSAPTHRIESFTRNGYEFDVLDAGPLDGEVVVLLHGFPERATCWDAVAPLLHAHGFRTLAPDQRGYSPGARPPRRRDYTSGELVDDIVELITVAGGRAHVVGHDWGANIAWSLAADRPDMVKTLTALSVPHPTAFIRAATRTRQGLKSWYMVFFQTPWVPEASAARPGGRMDRSLRAAGMTASDVQRFRTEIVDYGALTGGLNWYRALPFTDRTRFGRRVTVPTTMVWSDGDTFIDRAGVEGCADLVRAPYELVVLEGVNHWIPTQAADAAAEAILDRARSV
ncbi:alpha/beta fold hydrolase [Williamsia sp.]|uniref:alpha/beta fold hydrolase n=1 Tax=Williamsia sp. TaxID=1872085 RepID=UPI0025ECBDFE|nr:alpha/beta fold hydrolase [Williamsia sp.]